MGNPRGRGEKRPTGRDGDRFVALPLVVLDSPGYARLTHTARSLLLELMRQYMGQNNGQLMLTDKVLAKRGWKSADTISRAKADLIEAGLVFKTVQGGRPNRASWYALTFYTLDKHPRYDFEATLFKRGTYNVVNKIDSTTPPHGAGGVKTAPAGGTAGRVAAPSDGAMNDGSMDCSAPSHGKHLEMPSVGVRMAA